MNYLHENVLLEKMPVRWISDHEKYSAADFVSLAREPGEVQLEVCYLFGQGSNNVTLTPGDEIFLKHVGFRCSQCLKDVKKLFDSFCYPCFRKSASADLCLSNPQRCHFHLGTCREPEFGKSFCFQPHVLYLAYTDKFKVGLTRLNQMPTRWIDQGATAAAVLGYVTSRRQAGILESFMTKFISDKSHWSKMLQVGNDSPSSEEFWAKFREVKNALLDSEEYKAGSLTLRDVEGVVLSSDNEFFDESKLIRLRYPIGDVSKKPVSLNFDKTPEISSPVFGIKGQYLFLRDGVFNMRRHEGYVAEVRVQPFSIPPVTHTEKSSTLPTTMV